MINIWSCFVCYRAEIECEVYRKLSAREGVSVDDTDEEWAERDKENLKTETRCEPKSHLQK